jgi:vanillate O-demethylase ferredoxin subunit
MSEPLFPVRIDQIRYEAADILSFLLRRCDGRDFEPVDPGAHIDVHLGNDLMRSYSLSNGLGDDGAYRITVARDANSKGGSVFMHERIRVGQTIEISEPRNNFALAQDADLSVFIAGGIGVTPFLPMMRRLNESGKRWRLHYSARTPERAALLQEIAQLAVAGGGEFLQNFDEVPGGTMLDLPALLSAVSPGTHVYCCGPTGMLDAFRKAAATAALPDDHVHFEYFSSNIEGATEGGFTVVMAQSGREVVIAPGQTILHALNDAGANIAYSCEEGVCGACETRVIEGVPDHRDVILTDSERAAGKTMMVCCSGSKSPRLVLDL